MTVDQASIFENDRYKRVQAQPEQCLVELEQRVCHLERQVDDLLSRQDRHKPRRVAKKPERTTGPLPRHLVSLLTFARCDTRQLMAAKKGITWPKN
jgi:hypothetical protein